MLGCGVEQTSLQRPIRGARTLMTQKFWQFIGAEVWAPQTAECYGHDCECDIPDYGPHRSWVLDRTGHHPLGIENFYAVKKGNPLPYIRCECGWFDHALNYQQLHLDVVLTEKVWVYS